MTKPDNLLLYFLHIVFAFCAASSQWAVFQCGMYNEWYFTLYGPDVDIIVYNEKSIVPNDIL